MSSESLLDFAYDIIDMQRELIGLRAEVKRLAEYEKKYHELLNESIKHGDTMMTNLLKMALTPGVPEALIAHSKKVEYVQDELKDGINRF